MLLLGYLDRFILRDDRHRRLLPPSRPEYDPSLHAILREELSSRLDIAFLEAGNREESQEVVVNISIVSALFDPHSMRSLRPHDIVEIRLRMRAIVVVVLGDF